MLGGVGAVARDQAASKVAQHVARLRAPVADVAVGASHVAVLVDLQVAQLWLSPAWIT